jgi:hypothetical protein
VTPYELINVALFAWYIAYALIKTDGPAKIFARLRAVTTFFGLLECIVCLSIWTSALGYVLLQSPFALIVYFGAGAGLALWGHKYTGWSYDG